MNALAWKELKAQKVVSILILIAMILSTIATTALGQAMGILQSLRIKQAASLNGDRYVTFHQLTEEQNQILYLDQRLKDLGSYVNLGSVQLENSALTLYLREYHKDALKAYPELGKIKKGRLPQDKGEIALPEDVLKHLQFTNKLGETITLPISIGLKIDNRPNYHYTADFKLVGILESNYLGYATGIVDGMIGEGTAKEVLPERYFLYSTDFKTKDIKTFQATIDDIARYLKVKDTDIQYNWILLDALGISYNDSNEEIDTAAGFPFMIIACILTGFFVLLAAGLVIYNILKIAITKRIRWYGTLRAIGSEKGQLYALVATQLFILCAIGIPIGVGLGICIAKGLLVATTSLLNPELFLAENTETLTELIQANQTNNIIPLIFSILITLAFAMLAAFPSARYAANVSPTIAMIGQPVKIKRYKRHYKTIRNFENYYAKLNLKRHKSRTFITILSIAMSITIFIALQSVTNSLDASRKVQEQHTGDYAITNETNGLSPQLVEQVRLNEAVEKLNTTKLKVYSLDETGQRDIDVEIPLKSWETFQIAALDEERLLELVPHLSEADKSKLLDGTGCLIKNPISFSYEGQSVEHTQLNKGDTIVVEGKTLKIIDIITYPITVNNEGYLNGVQMIGSPLLYDTLVGNKNYAEIYPTLKESANANDFENWLENWCNETIGSHWLSYRLVDKELADSFKQIQLICWGLILFIGFIGILNIINTVYTNIQTRINEMGIQRAIGMSIESIYRTFLWEGFYYAIIASGIGTICGSICTLLIEAEKNGGLSLASIPFIPILEAIIVSIAVCLLATAIPLGTVQKMSIVDAIETIE